MAGAFTGGVHVRGHRYDFGGLVLQIGCKHCRRLYSKVANKKDCCDTKCNAQSSVAAAFGKTVNAGRMAHSITERVLPAGATSGSAAVTAEPASAQPAHGTSTDTAGKAPKQASATAGVGALLQTTWARLHATNEDGPREHVRILFEEQKVYYEFPQVRCPPCLADAPCL